MRYLAEPFYHAVLGGPSYATIASTGTTEGADGDIYGSSSDSRSQPTSVSTGSGSEFAVTRRLPSATLPTTIAPTARSKR
jgi:hypothetical protein